MSSRHGATSVFVGQQSLVVSQIINSLFDRFGFPNTLSLNVIDHLGATNKESNTLSICKCSHSLLHLEYCQFCRRNEETVINSFRALLEEQDWAPNLFFCLDMSKPLSIWIYHHLARFLESNSSNSLIETCLIKPPSETFGIDSFISVASMHDSVVQSDALFIRGYEEYLNSADFGNKDSRYDLTCLSKRIACDLLFAIAPHDGIHFNQGEYTTFPSQIISQRNKLIDIRSSLYKSLSRIDSQKAKGINNVELHPLRYLSSNLHHLHLYHHSFITEHLQLFNILNCTGSSCSFRFDGKHREMKFISGYDTADVNNTINWATSSTTAWYLYENELSHQVTPSFKSSISGDFAKKPLDVTTLTIHSLYAGLEIFRECGKVKDLIKRSAYRHSMEDSKLASETMTDNILFLESYLQNRSPS